VAGLLAGRDKRPEDGTFCIGQVGRVRMRIHPAEVATAPSLTHASSKDQRAIKLLNSL